MCPNCENGELVFEECYTSNDWIQVVVQCNECGCHWQGDIQVEDLFQVEEA